MRFLLALVPPQNTLCTYVHAAQMLFAPVHEGYILSEHSVPHITLCQFECQTEKEALAVWNQMQKQPLPIASPRFTGVHFVKGVGAYKEHYWAELSVAREPEIMQLHQFAIHVLRSQGLHCINDNEELYRPHLTLARIRLSGSVPRWPDALISSTGNFTLSLARGDDNGQYLCTLISSP